MNRPLPPHMATAAGEPYEAVKDNLARTIRKRRSECIPGETARELLSVEAPNHTQLVGVDYAAEKAVYYSCQSNEVIFVRFGSDGLADGGPVMGSFEEGPGFEAWIEKMSAYWGWLHPRYR